MCSLRERERERDEAAVMALARRIPLIKFPNRRGLPVPASSNSGVPTPTAPPASSASVKTAMPVGAAAEGGTAASQPPRTAVSPQEIEAILLGGVV